MSAASASDAWELRCDVREQLINYLQKNHPDCLPKIRATVLGGNFEHFVAMTETCSTIQALSSGNIRVERKKNK